MSVFGLKNLVLLNPVCPTEYKKTTFRANKDENWLETCPFDTKYILSYRKVNISIQKIKLKSSKGLLELILLMAGF